MKTIFGYFSDLFGSRLPYTAVMFGILLILAVFFFKDTRREERFVALLAIVPLLTVLTGILVSVLITPFFIARYLLPCMGLIALFLAVSFGGALAKTGFFYAVKCVFGCDGCQRVLCKFSFGIRQHAHQ